MKFFSTNHQSPEVDLRTAVMRGLAPDGGLYLPKKLPSFSAVELDSLRGRSFAEVAEIVAEKLFAGDLPKEITKRIFSESYNFPISLVKLSENISVLELFYGPTLAFKDVAARFMARLMSYYVKNTGRELTVIVATSGDTGSAVAHGFYKVPGIRVVILYPSGKVSHLQEQQLTTLGENITALEVNGTFDDCQRLVKQALSDGELADKLSLASANSINIARLLPQSFYYFYAWAQSEVNRPLIMSVPSGNLGNLTAGVLAKRMGLPIAKFIASTNINDEVPEYLKSGQFKARPSSQTISNAMDVGSPSNFARLRELYKNDVDKMRADLFGASFTDDETKAAMRELYKQYKYLADPHGAVGYLGLKKYLADAFGNVNGIFIETAHPAKFREVVHEAVGVDPDMPKRLADCLGLKKSAIVMPASFEDLKAFLLR